jgi:hypothetical protein
VTAEPLLQTVATEALSAILKYRVLAGQVFTFGVDLW